MVNSKMKRALLGAALCVATGLGSIAPAQAAVYSGRWDPAFGGIFPDLGWKGSATFIVPDACLGQSGLFPNDNLLNPVCGGNAMQVLDATLEFYNHTTDPLGLNILQTFSLGSEPLVNSMTLLTVAGVTNLIGVDTGFFAPALGTISIAGNGAFDFHLILSGDQAQLAYTRPIGTGPSCAFTIPGIYTPNPANCGFSQNSAHTTFTRVPEPGTAALVLAAMAVLVGIRRQRA